MNHRLTGLLTFLLLTAPGTAVNADADIRQAADAETADAETADAETADAETADAENEIADAAGHFNLPIPTMGGKQLWADRLHFRQWRIQRNVVTGHYRLLDPRDIRRAWGTYEECQRELEAVKRRDKLPAMQGKAVIVLHGLIRTRSAMKGLAKHLREEGEYEVFNVSYPSSRASIADHAQNLAHIIDNLDGIDEINFVCHSLGNIVLRRYLADQTDPATGRAPDERIKRIVMLAPPNNGAALAKRWGDQKWFQLVLGAPGDELGKQWEEVEKQLATPACEFGILAGGKGTPRGRNPLIPGDDDLVVTVDETRLPGARDFAVLPFGHTFIMDHARTREYVLRFLEHGYFVSRDKRQPIPAE